MSPGYPLVFLNEWLSPILPILFWGGEYFGILHELQQGCGFLTDELEDVRLGVIEFGAENHVILPRPL